MNEADTMLMADFANSEFPTIPGFPHPTQRSIMPVVAFRGDEVHPVGTCFAISNHGLVLTARHVVDAALALNSVSEDGWWLAALYAAEPESGDDGHDLVGGILSANKVYLIPSLDIAAIHLNLPIRKDTKQPLRMPALRLSPGIPEVASPCVAIGYHSMDWNQVADGTHTHDVLQSYSASRGDIKQIHFPRRDNATHTFPCFEVSARFDGGMSGGPVIGSSGNVVGVVCSTFGEIDEHGHISHASLIGPALLLQVDAQLDDGTTGLRFLYDFCTGGSVVLDETAASLKVDRSADTLSIDFGRPPLITNCIGS